MYIMYISYMYIMYISYMYIIMYNVLWYAVDRHTNRKEREREREMEFDEYYTASFEGAAC